MVNWGKLARIFLMVALVTTPLPEYEETPLANDVTMALRSLTPAIGAEEDETVVPAAPIGEGSVPMELPELESAESFLQEGEQNSTAEKIKMEISFFIMSCFECFLILLPVLLF